MVKNKYPIIFVCVIFLLCLGSKRAMGEDYVKNIERGEASIDFNQNEFPHAAYLHIEFKNNGDKKIANLTFEISYYDEEGILIEKVVVKDALTETMPKGEKKKYRIRLKGDIVNIEHEQYPYSQQERVKGFDIKIISVKFASK